MCSSRTSISHKSGGRAPVKLHKGRAHPGFIDDGCEDGRQSRLLLESRSTAPNKGLEDCIFHFFPNIGTFGCYIFYYMQSITARVCSSQCCGRNWMWSVSVQRTGSRVEKVDVSLLPYSTMETEERKMILIQVPGWIHLWRQKQGFYYLASQTSIFFMTIINNHHINTSL